jgi:hypothetical protein
LGETYDRSRKVADEAAIAAKREEALASFGQNSDLAALGQTLLRAGDLEGGMQALRLHAANEGTPFQRARAAAEDAARAQTHRDLQDERNRLEAGRQRDDARQDRLQPYTGTDEFKDPKQGLRDPVTGDIYWQDGTTTPGPKRGAIGPQSSLTGDENLPPIGGQSTVGSIGTPRPNSTAEVGYVIPGTQQGFPHGTVRAPQPVQTANMPAVGATETAGAGQPAVAGPVAAPAVANVPPQAPQAPQAPTAPTTPVTATMINQGTSNIAPMSNAEMIAEARRIGVSPAQYRQARAAAIQKEMETKATGGVDAAKSLGEQAGKIAVGEQFLANAPAILKDIEDGWQTGLLNRTMAVNGWGRRGEVDRQIASGIDALVHMMTGSGMSESEAKRKVGRYEPSLKDGPAEARSKFTQLVSEITQYRELAYRGRGAMGPLPQAQPQYGSEGGSPAAPPPMPAIGETVKVGDSIIRRVK